MSAVASHTHIYIQLYISQIFAENRFDHMGHIKKIKQIIENDKSIFFPAALKKLKTSIK